MALKAKTALVQIRVDPDLLEQYQAACDYFECTVSAGLRSSMELTVRNHHRFLQTALDRAALKAKATPKKRRG